MVLLFSEKPAFRLSIHSNFLYGKEIPLSIRHTGVFYIFPKDAFSGAPAQNAGQRPGVPETLPLNIPKSPA